MHEITYAKFVINEAKRVGARKEVKIEVGELCDIESFELKEAMAGLIDWKLDVYEKESRIKCKCGYDGRAKIVDRGHGYCFFGCPECSAVGKDLNVLEGGEIKIVGVE
jgi:Zn finger protein HypA/HybF involved in hydrogenase expression